MPLPKKMPRSGGGKNGKDSEGPRVAANRYEFVKKLGSGNFGTAWLVKDRKCENELKVLKEISVGDLQPDETVDAMHEAKLLSKLDHPGIVKFHDSFLDGEFFCIVTEYCEGGDLGDQITKYQKQGKKFKESLVIEWFIQLVIAVQFMHSKRVLHRDLKTRNIFLKNNRIKLGDFGISRILMGTSDLATTFTGTPYYMSPEVLKHEGYNSKSDVWSIACILFELCALSHAFDGQSLMGVMYKIVEGKPPELPENYSKDLGNVYKLMLEKDPHKRLSATEVTKDPFIARHLEKLKNVMTERHQAKDISRQEAQDIERYIKGSSHLSDLKEKEDTKMKHLTPRERMRLRKQQQADAEAKKYKEIAMANLAAKEKRMENHKKSLNETSEAVLWLTGAEKRSQPSKALHEQRSQSEGDFRPQTAPSPTRELDEDDEAFDEANRSLDKTQAVTMVPNPNYKYNQNGAKNNEYSGDPFNRNKLNVKRGGSFEDRPITPMKDTSLYDKNSSKLTFEDGVPTDIDTANTYYSQHDDFEDEEEEIEEDLKDGEGEDDDLQDLIGMMQEAIDTTLDKSLTVHDDTVAGAFGPAARNVKIRNLRAECETKLGKEAFDHAYKYLRESRFSDNSTTIDETLIMKKLRKVVPNPSDCFLVDQLLFLEEQAKIAHM